MRLQLPKTVAIIAITAVLLLALVGGYFLLRGSWEAPTPAIPEVTAPKEVPEEAELEEVTPPPSEVKEIVVSGTDYAFEPPSITVSTGEPVKIIFQNQGRINHNLVIEDLGVGTKTIGPGQTDVVEFTAPTGTYAIFCSVPGHRVAGMEGSLIVE